MSPLAQTLAGYVTKAREAKTHDEFIGAVRDALTVFKAAKSAMPKPIQVTLTVEEAAIYG